MTRTQPRPAVAATAGALLGLGVATAPPLPASIPTVDIAAIAQIVELATTISRQIQTLTGIQLNLGRIEQLIGTVDQVSAYRARIGGHMTELNHTLESPFHGPIDSLHIAPSLDEVDPISPESIRWESSVPGADMFASASPLTPGMLNIALDISPDAPTVPSSSSAQVTGPFVDEEVDARGLPPVLANDDTARDWLVRRYYAPHGAPAQTVDVARVQTNRGSDLHAMSAAAFSTAARTQAIWPAQKELESKLTEELAQASSLREDLSIIAHASIASLRLESQRTRIAAEQLMLVSVQSIAHSPPLLTRALYDRLGAPRTDP